MEKPDKESWKPEYRQAWAKANPEAIRKINRAYRDRLKARDPEVYREMRRNQTQRYRLKKKGLIAEAAAIPFMGYQKRLDDDKNAMEAGTKPKPLRFKKRMA